MILFLIVSGAVFRPQQFKEQVTQIIEQAENYVAGAFFKESVDDKELVERYEVLKTSDSSELRRRKRQGLSTEDIKVLIVPGHDDEHIGASYKGVREVDLNREVAANLFNFIKDEPGFDVTLASDSRGYHKDLQKYFDKEGDSILEFREEYKDEMESLVKRGKVDLVNGVFHNAAPGDMAQKLYGINKWVNENEFDIVLHIHFNDYAGRKNNQSGKYNGFSIYIPEKQFSNARASRVFAEHLEKQLSEFFPVSNNKGESSGIIEDQELIAIGAYNTVDAISILVEYGYIYENQFSDPVLRELMTRELAFQTFQGIKSFFNDEVEETTTLLSEKIINSDLYEGQKSHPGVLSLQAHLRLSGLYPPEGKSLSECPIAGNFGDCTKDAVKEFQLKNNIVGSGYVGGITRSKLMEQI